MKTMIMKSAAAILLMAAGNFKAQQIEANFWKLDENMTKVDNPTSSSVKDKGLALNVFGLDGIKKYTHIKGHIEIVGWYVDEYTFPLEYVNNATEFYEAAPVSKIKKPGTKNQNLILVTTPDQNTEREAEFSITSTHNKCGEKYIYSKEGCGNVKEYTLKFTFYGMNEVKERKRNSASGEMEDISYFSDPVKLSNTCEIKIITSSDIPKAQIELSIGKKSDLLDAIQSGNDFINGDSDKKKKKK